MTNSTAKEKDIRDKLYDLWGKEAVRVIHIPNDWIEKRVTLGIGVGIRQGMKPIQEMMDTIEDFGVDIEVLKKMEPNYQSIVEIYEAITTYRIAVRYLKELKEHMSTFDSFKWWDNS